MTTVVGEIMTQAILYYDSDARSVVAGSIGFGAYVVDRSSVDSKGLSDRTYEALVNSCDHHVSDTVLDACPTAGPVCKVACKTAKKDNLVMVACEMTTRAKLDYDEVARGVVAGTGLCTDVVDLSSHGANDEYFEKCDEPLLYPEPLKAVRKLCADYAGPEMTDPSMHELKGDRRSSQGRGEQNHVPHCTALPLGLRLRLGQ